LSTSRLKSIDRSNFSNLCNCRPERDRQKSQNQVHTSLEDPAISFRAFLAYLPPFQSYGGFKKLERPILLRLIVPVSGKVALWLENSCSGGPREFLLGTRSHWNMLKCNFRFTLPMLDAEVMYFSTTNWIGSVRWLVPSLLPAFTTHSYVAPFLSLLRTTLVETESLLRAVLAPTSR